MAPCITTAGVASEQPTYGWELSQKTCATVRDVSVVSFIPLQGSCCTCMHHVLCVTDFTKGTKSLTRSNQHHLLSAWVGRVLEQSIIRYLIGTNAKLINFTYTKPRLWIITCEINKNVHAQNTLSRTKGHAIVGKWLTYVDLATNIRFRATSGYR